MKFKLEQNCFDCGFFDKELTDCLFSLTDKDMKLPCMDVFEFSSQSKADEFLTEMANHFPNAKVVKLE